MKVADLIGELQKLDPNSIIIYPGLTRDYEVEIVALVPSPHGAEDAVLLANELETPGNPRPMPPDPIDDPGVQGVIAAREELEVKLSAVVALVHECYHLLAAARPRYWLLRGDVVEAASWMRRNLALTKILDETGLAPPPRVPKNVEGKLREALGLPRAEPRDPEDPPDTSGGADGPGDPFPA